MNSDAPNEKSTDLMRRESFQPAYGLAIQSAGPARRSRSGLRQVAPTGVISTGSLDRRFQKRHEPAHLEAAGSMASKQFNDKYLVLVRPVNSGPSFGVCQHILSPDEVWGLSSRPTISTKMGGMDR